MKMRKILFSLLMILMLIIVVACGKKEAPTEDANAQQQGATNEAVQDYHIGVITVSVSQAEDNFRGAEAVAKKYGLSTEGGKITVVTIPDNFMQEQETTISQMVSLADELRDRKSVV